jgi:hypothetical protein
VRIWQRTPQDGIDYAEERRVSADPDRQREYCCEREGRALQQHPHAITQVLKERIDKSDSTYIAMSLLQQSDVSELASRSPSRLSLAHSLADISLGE